MAEIKSVQAAKITATTNRAKLNPNESHGRVRLMFAELAATHSAVSINDTILFGTIPQDARIIDVVVSNASGTASAALDIGVRKTKDLSVIDADGISVAVDVAAAGTKSAPTGALIANGATYITPAEVDVYATVKGAAIAANQALNVKVLYVTD